MRNPSLRKESRRLILLSKQRHMSPQSSQSPQSPQPTPELNDLVSITKLNGKQTAKDRSVSIFKSLKAHDKQYRKANYGQLDSFLKDILQTEQQTVEYRHIIKQRLLELILQDQSLKDEITDLMQLNQYQKQLKKSHDTKYNERKPHVTNRKFNMCIIRKTVNYTFKPTPKYPTQALKFDEIILEKKKHKAELQGKLNEEINFMKEVEQNVNYLKSQFAGYQQRIKDLFSLKKMQRSQPPHQCTSKVAKDIKIQQQRLTQLNRISQCAKLHYQKEYLNNIGHQFKIQLVHLICILHDHLNPKYHIEDEQRVEFFVKNVIITYQSLLYPLMQSHRDKDAHLSQIKVEIEKYNDLRDERKAILQRLKREFTAIDLKSGEIFKRYNQEERQVEGDGEGEEFEQNDGDEFGDRIEDRKTKLNNQLNINIVKPTPNTLSPNFTKSFQNQVSVSTLVSFNTISMSKGKLPDIKKRGKAKSVMKYQPIYLTQIDKDIASLKECFQRTATMFKRSVVLGSCAME